MGDAFSQDVGYEAQEEARCLEERGREDAHRRE